MDDQNVTRRLCIQLHFIFPYLRFAGRLEWFSYQSVTV